VTPNTIGVFANPRKARLEEVLSRFLPWLDGRGIGVRFTEEQFDLLRPASPNCRPVAAASFGESCDLVVAMGGDGTVLNAARLIGPAGKPLFGVNLGSLGFLAEVPVEDLIPRMEAVLSGAYRIEKRMALEVEAPAFAGAEIPAHAGIGVLKKPGSEIPAKAGIQSPPNTGVHGKSGAVASIPAKVSFPSAQRTGIEATKKSAVETPAKRVYRALNDVVLDRGGSPRIIRIRVEVDGRPFNTFRSDGLIAATPTGSTAYSLSASGPIVVPTLESIILCPICPHSLTARPTVIEGSSTVRLRIESARNPAMLSIDGQIHMDIRNDASVLIRRAPEPVHWLTFEDHDFFDLLRKKLHWGGPPRK
jgi:NAD kinase